MHMKLLRNAIICSFINKLVCPLQQQIHLHTRHRILILHNEQESLTGRKTNVEGAV